MPTPARSALLVLLVAAATGCLEPTYSPPGAALVKPWSPPLTVGPPIAFPPLTKPGTIYVDPAPLDPSAPRPSDSRYVLYEDGTHMLQAVNARGLHEFRGLWTRADSTIVFTWEGWSIAGPWGATGTVRGQQLVVRYNLIMQMTDFEDATYVRAPAGS